MDKRLARDIKAVAVRFAHAASRFNKSQCIHALWTHFNNIHNINDAENVVNVVVNDVNDVNDVNEDEVSWTHFINIHNINVGNDVNDVNDVNIVNEDEVSWIHPRRQEQEYVIIRPTKLDILINEDIKNDENEECPICISQIKHDEVIMLNCSHIFCGTCIDDSIKQIKTLKCALCRAPITSVSINSDKMYNLMENACY
jgi:hypothetical protein